MGKIFELKPLFVEFMPEKKEEGILYISNRFKLAIHLCACGCKQEVVSPLDAEDGWILTNNDSLITLRPSIGNWNGEKTYHAHYYITRNKVEWL
jgi:hypothetical protein